MKLPQVSDGMIQGKSVRLILKKEATPDDIRHAEGMPEININETTPRFEDAFIDLLGGAGTSESPLGAILIGTSDPQKRGHTRRYSPCRRDAGNQHQRNYAAF